MKKTLILALLLAPFLSFASIDQNLKYRQSGLEVSEFQDFLISKGFLSGNSTGFFGLMTLQGAKDYQTSVGLPSTGFVGSMTREKVNAEIGNLISSSNEAEIKETGTVKEITPCSKGDLFDVKTGKSCNVTNTLVKKINELQEQVKAITSYVIQTPVIETPSVPTISYTATINHYDASGYCQDHTHDNFTLGNIVVNNVKEGDKANMVVSSSINNSDSYFIGGVIDQEIHSGEYSLDNKTAYSETVIKMNNVFKPVNGSITIKSYKINGIEVSGLPVTFSVNAPACQ